MRVVLGFLMVLLACFSVQARSLGSFLVVKKDTNFIVSYYNDLIIRLYTVEKLNSLQLTDLISTNRLNYQPNGYYNIGVGVNLRSFGVSLAGRIPFTSRSDSRHGDTKKFGIQTYLYTSKFSVDLLTSFQKGYYLYNSAESLKSYSNNIEYQRPDIFSFNIGATINYIFNNTRFSYRAAFKDTEQQKHSAGSLISGFSVYSYQTQADSSIVPREIDSGYFQKSRDITRTGVLTFNSNLGYAYSLIFLKNGIITLSYVLGSGIQTNSFDRDFVREPDSWRFSLNHSGRIGIGYWFNKYYARVSIIRSTQYTKFNYNDLSIENGTNFIQFSLGKRISLINRKKKRTSN